MIEITHFEAIFAFFAILALGFLIRGLVRRTIREADDSLRKPKLMQFLQDPTNRKDLSLHEVYCPTCGTIHDLRKDKYKNKHSMFTYLCDPCYKDAAHPL